MIVTAPVDALASSPVPTDIEDTPAVPVPVGKEEIRALRSTCSVPSRNII